MAFDLKVFFSVVDKTPVRVTSSDVMAFIRSQRSGDTTVVRIDGSSGRSARTIRRRLSSVSGFYAYLLARGDTSVVRNPERAGSHVDEWVRRGDDQQAEGAAPPAGRRGPCWRPVMKSASRLGGNLAERSSPVSARPWRAGAVEGGVRGAYLFRRVGEFDDESEARVVRAQMSRTAALLWGSAGLITLASVLLPRPVGYRPVGVAAAATVGLVAGAGLLAAGWRIPPLMHFFVALGGVQVITLGSFYAGPQGSPFGAMLYVWAATYAFYWYRRRLAIAMCIVIGLDYAALIALQHGNNFPATRWLFTMTTVVVTSALVSYLTENVLRLAFAERAARLEAERAKAQLLVVSRHKSEFLASMSHELRTPLNAIIGFSEVLRDRFFGELNDKQAEYVEDIHASGRHLLALINDILDLAKIEAGRMDLDLSTFSVAQVIGDAVAVVRERAGRRGIAVSVTIDPTLVAIEADERKFKQILLNLLSNAVKFTEVGDVQVEARAGDGEFEVSVRDSGIGIPEAEQARIFEEFHQVRASPSPFTTTAREGTGLGLALAKRFVELHGGRISVHSRPGEGSTFTFTLPLRQHPHDGDAATGG